MTVHFLPPEQKMYPTVVYLHGYGSCLDMSENLLRFTIPYGIALVAFDFSGSGKSAGNCTTFGVKEKHDVEVIVEYLESEGVSRIVLWGWSMGASTALMYAALNTCNPVLRGMVLDSPFTTFQEVTNHTISRVLGPMKFMTGAVQKILLPAARKEALRLTGQSIEEDSAIEGATRVPSHIPALFAHGTEDEVVPISQGRDVYESYAGEQKEWISMRGVDHCDIRPPEVDDKMFLFVTSHLLDVDSGDFAMAVTDWIDQVEDGMLSKRVRRLQREYKRIRGRTQ